MQEQDEVVVKRVLVRRAGEMAVRVATDSTGARSVELWAAGQVIFAVDRMPDGSITGADGEALGTLTEVRDALVAFLKAL